MTTAPVLVCIWRGSRGPLLSLQVIHVANIGTPVGADEELPVVAEIDAVVVAVGDGNFSCRIV